MDIKETCTEQIRITLIVQTWINLIHMDEHTQREEWRERFRAVAKAQGRYLWILLITGIFYLALDTTISQQAESPSQNLPLIGIEVDSKIVWASGSLVLSLIILAALGTFPAVTHASSKVNPDDNGSAFERIDTEPTAIDLIVYTKPGASRLARLSLVTYPLFISLGVIESSWLWIRLVRSQPFSNLRWIFLVLGGAVTIACLPRLIGLWKSKINSIIRGK